MRNICLNLFRLRNRPDDEHLESETGIAIHEYHMVNNKLSIRGVIALGMTFGMFALTYRWLGVLSTMGAVLTAVALLALFANPEYFSAQSSQGQSKTDNMHKQHGTPDAYAVMFSIIIIATIGLLSLAFLIAKHLRHFNPFTR